MREEIRKKLEEKKNFNWTVHNELETRDFGLELSSYLKPGDVLALEGDLGTGKTTLTKYIAEGLGIHENVSSPTFNIVKEHRSGRIPLFHFDAYRLGSGDELLDIGAEDYFYGDGISVVEWSDIVEDVLPEESLLIRIRYGENEGERIYQCIF